MKHSILFLSSLLLSSICLSQTYLSKLPNNANRMSKYLQSNSVKAKTTQLSKSRTSGYNDIGGTEKWSEYYYEYNDAGMQTLEGAVFYNEDGSGEVSRHTKEISTYQNDTRLLKNEFLTLESNGIFKLRKTEDYFYDSHDLLERIERTTDSFGDSMFVTEVEFFGYNNNDVMVYNELNTRSNANAEFVLVSKMEFEFGSDKLLGEAREFECSNSNDCYLIKRQSFIYNVIDLVDYTAIEEFNSDGSINSSSTVEYFYDQGGERILSVMGEEYNAETEEFSLTFSGELEYQGNGKALEKFEIVLYDAQDTSVSDRLLFDEFNYNYDVTKEEILFPFEFFDFSSPEEGMFFGNMLYSYRRRAKLNNETDFERGELFEYEYSVINSVPEKANLDFIIGPNPVFDVANILFNGNLPQRIEIFNLAGILIHTQNNFGATATISVESLEPGPYFVKVTSDKGVVSKQFMKL